MNSKINRIVIAAALSLFASAPAFADPTTCPNGSHLEGRTCVTDLPEPGSLPLFILGAVAIGVASRLFKKK